MGLNIKLNHDLVIQIKCKCCDKKIYLTHYKMNANKNIVPVPISTFASFEGDKDLVVSRLYREDLAKDNLDQDLPTERK